MAALTRKEVSFVPAQKVASSRLFMLMEWKTSFSSVESFYSRKCTFHCEPSIKPIDINCDI